MLTISEIFKLRDMAVEAAKHYSEYSQNTRFSEAERFRYLDDCIEMRELATYWQTRINDMTLPRR